MKENREKREQQDDKKPPSPSASPKKPPSPLVKPRTSRSPSPNGKLGLAAVAGNNGTPAVETEAIAEEAAPADDDESPIYSC